MKTAYDKPQLSIKSIRAIDLPLSPDGLLATDQPVFRTGRIEAVPVPPGERAAGEGEEQYIFELSFSSEEPYRRWYGIEILGHKRAEVEMDWLKGGTAPLLNQHNDSQQIGVISKAWLEGGRGKAIVRFGKSALAQEIRADVLDGIRGNVSVGYIPKKMILEEESEDGPDVYRVTEWEPLEVSIVSVPADKTVGVGRAHETAPATNIQKDTNMDKHDTTAAPPAPQPSAPQIDVKAERADALKQERDRISQINEVAAKTEEKHPHLKARALADKAIADGASVSDFRGQLLDKFVENHKPSESPAKLNMRTQDVRRFSIRNAILAQIPGSKVDAGLERECSDELSRRLGRSPQGFFLPEDVLQHRDLTIGGGGTGSYVVDTDLQGDNFIDALRNRMALTTLGARTLPGLVGDIAIPKLGTASTAYWVTEGVAPTESTQVLAQVTGTPHTVGTYTDISRKLLIQSTPAAEQLVRDDLARTIAIGIDAAGFVGTGSGGQPTGVTGLSSVNNPSISSAGTPTYAEILAFIENIMTDNADVGEMAWAMTPEVMVKLAQTMTNATYGEIPILNLRDKECLGYRYAVTNQVGANTLIFGVWSQLIVGLWSGVDILADPYTNSTSGTLRVRILQDVDIMARHDQSFAYNSAVTA